ncbi:hypothetical protein DPMN_187266 [Dreissena polymorpha]|uniref:Uncharacterized protein n=1 Tax=Dreissena polymorpha TaxID=45954 RepID=A0A9D4DQN8_DREPO|nr:hypothetical protein DPMN_187266 [Dreissena polymorpha]
MGPGLKSRFKYIYSEIVREEIGVVVIDCWSLLTGGRSGRLDCTYHLSERTLIKVLVLAPDPKNAGLIAYRASAQTGARTRTTIACEASSHSGTRKQEMLLTELVLISATARLKGDC